MDASHGPQIQNHEVNEVVVGQKKKNCSLEDTNCNLTVIPTDELIIKSLDLDKTCGGNKGTTVCVNGPKNLVNGLDDKPTPLSNSRPTISDNNSFSKDNSSQCETCVRNNERDAAACETSSVVNNCRQMFNSGHYESNFVNNDGSSPPPSQEVDPGAAEDGLNPEEGSRNAKCSSPQQSDDQSSRAPLAVDNCETETFGISYVSYESELQMPDIMRLIQKDLSEPYSIYTYRYFIHNWPQLCFLAMDGSTCVGAIVCKLDMHIVVKRGYIAMLAVDEKYRKRKIGSNLVLKAIRAMVADGADEIVLETEITNKPALRLYENLGFVRDKRLFRYYLNGVDALRLKLWLR